MLALQTHVAKSETQYTHIKLSMVTCLYNLTLVGGDSWIQRAPWSSSLAEGTSFQFSEKSFVKVII